ncbi:glutathione ABC transporter substrate-binding protein [Alkalicoccus urumqiensis]|uniref:Glutathione ABC transporter substrate-binding protein n=2 Tax=Alkalicoccus urumqiensis TaxID=1548213 RepID=A0A2P6MJ66_ALKUR|nr:glutathione ABC transporter substrate-binding protein [Alkalicoccus urumqiensis]
MKKRITVLSLLPLLAACAAEPDNSGETEAPQNNEENNNAEEAADPDALNVAMQADVNSLDPHFGNDHPSLNVKRTIFDTLVKTDENLDLSMSLAESFEQVEPEVWEIQLKEGIQFHDGNELTADVVKMNVDRMLNPDVASTMAFMFDMITDVEVVDNYTVRLTTEYPFAPLRQHFAHPAGQMVSPDVLQEDLAAMENGEQPGSVINENPVGTGPYQFVSQEPGERIELEANPDYFADGPGAETLTFTIVPEDLTRVGELETESSQIIGHLNPDDIERVEENEETDVARYDSASLAYFGFNTEKAPFDDPDVRRAVAMAVNKEEIVEGAAAGAAIPAEGPLAPPVFGSAEELDPIPYDPEGAQELLQEAGYEDGFSVELWSDDSRTRLDTAELLQGQLSAVGIDVDIESMEAGVHRERVSEGEHEMFLGSWGTVTGDADYGLYPVFHSDSFGMTGNRTFFANDEVDQLLEAGRREMDEAARLELYEEAQQIIVDEAPLVPLYHTEHLAGLRSDLQNFYIHPSSLYELTETTRTMD